MKTIIYSQVMLITFLGFSQMPIVNYDSANGSKYAIVSTVIDNSPSGADATWNFTGLTKIGETIDIYTAPTAPELVEFPNTTSVLTYTRTGDNERVFSENNSGTISLTGIEAQGVVLRYNDFDDGITSVIGDKALIGTFPLSYTMPTTVTIDNVAGNFSEPLYGINGVFTGTITSEVDAYGTLVVNGTDVIPFNGAVTRLKIVQDLDLSVANGKVIQSSYNYYDDSNGNLVFRTSTIEITSSLFSETTTITESLSEITLGTFGNETSELTLSLFPNPVKDKLNLALSNDTVINSITISDISGRQIIKDKNNIRPLSVNQLSAGIYVASIVTNKGTFSRKFIKE